jgi:hypothetical protein
MCLGLKCFPVMNIGHVSPLFIGFSGHGKVGVRGVSGGEHRAKVEPTYTM